MVHTRILLRVGRRDMEGFQPDQLSHPSNPRYSLGLRGSFFYSLSKVRKAKGLLETGVMHTVLAKVLAQEEGTNGVKHYPI